MRLSGPLLVDLAQPTSDRRFGMCDRRPNDREALQHQAPLAQSKIDRSLKHVPGYLVPKAMLKNPHSAIGQARSALGGRGANPTSLKRSAQIVSDLC